MHFTKLAPRVQRLFGHGAVEWAVGITAHNALLQGGEVGTIDASQGTPDPQRILLWSSLEWKSPSPESQGRPWLVLWFAWFLVRDGL